MKKHLLLLIAFCGLFKSQAQLYDKTWVCGSYASKVTFELPAIDTSSFNPHIFCYSGWACISDKEGNFQFFTEGVNVYCNDGSLISNGQDLADNLVNQDFNTGLPDFQNFLVLPKKEHQYYIINQSLTDPFYTANPFWPHPNALYYSIVDMDMQNGRGQVAEKRQQINTGYFMDGHLTACQHANGRDWWLVHRRYNSNGYLIYLVTSDSISFVREQFIGAISQEPDAVGQSAFSADGSKYATITGKSPLIILDFDRCEGLFSNPKSVKIPIDTFTFYGYTKITGDGGDGLCFSPNGRFIYVNSVYILRQYDLLANPIDSSEQVLFLWTDTNEYLGQFNQMHLGPDGRIYAAPYQGFTYALHTIDYPDSPGLACGFKKWGLPIATSSACFISNMVNFRMGPLVGSGCDTIRTDIRHETLDDRKIRVYPNPARDVVDIDLLSYNYYHPQQQFYLYDLQGRLIKQVALPYLSAQLNVSDLPAGIYHWRLAIKTETKAEGKIEVVR